MPFLFFSRPKKHHPSACCDRVCGLSGTSVRVGRKKPLRVGSKKPICVGRKKPLLCRMKRTTAQIIVYPDVFPMSCATFITRESTCMIKRQGPDSVGRLTQNVYHSVKSMLEKTVARKRRCVMLIQQMISLIWLGKNSPIILD